MPVSYRGVLINYSPSSPAYRVWDYTRQKVCDVAAPAFDEDADPRWWRTPLHAAAEGPLEDEEPLFFRAAPPPPAGPAKPESEVIDSSPDVDAAADDASSQPPADTDVATTPVLAA